MKKIPVLLCLIVFGCAPPQTNIQESDVTATLEGFFNALDVENEKADLFYDYVTNDFIIYEFGKKMSKEEFLEFISGPSPITETKWDFDDVKISTDINSAHVSLFNTGSFVVETDSVNLHQKYEWLESAFMVKEGDQLKIKFYFSDNINIETDTIN
jgi:hypothetical protein